MSFQVLSRKYRPKLFREVVGQDHITRALQNAMSRPSQLAMPIYLPVRGELARPLRPVFWPRPSPVKASQEDGDPCLKCTCCTSVDKGASIDVQEIDGASYNGVEHIRDLVENVRHLPSFGQYKVYIIDEVHMLSTPAFNALLKTLGRTSGPCGLYPGHN